MKAITGTLLALVVAVGGRGDGAKHNVVPKDGYVPTNRIAKKDGRILGVTHGK